MAGILGDFGELIWRHFWEAREPIAKLVCMTVNIRIEYDDPPERPSEADIVIWALGPVFKGRLGREALDHDLIERFASFLREAMAHEGNDKWLFDYTLEMYLFHLIDDAAAAAAVAEVDPELVSMVKERYQVWLEY